MFRSAFMGLCKCSAFRPTSLLTVLLLMATGPTMAQDPGNEGKPAKLFDSSETLEVSLIAPWRELVRNKSYQGTYPAEIEYTDELGNVESLDLTVERRGVTRQQVCKMPPVKLQFEKGSAKGTTFRGQKSIKLVTHCQMASKYEQYYILEMLAYRMHNLLTDYSFRVRPLKITYHQTESGDSEKPRFSFIKKKKLEGPVFAFLIEDDSDVADRHGLKKLKIPRVSPTQLDSDETALLALFQYMISNLDWAALRGHDPKECCHNVKLIGPKSLKPDDTIYAIPYDFDSSGLVNSEYAVPPNGLSIRRVTQRLYRGYCAHNPSLARARQKMFANEQAIYDLVKAESRLEPGVQRKTVNFLEKFFETIKDEEKYQEKIVQKCR